MRISRPPFSYLVFMSFKAHQKDPTPWIAASARIAEMVEVDQAKLQRGVHSDGVCSAIVEGSSLCSSTV